MQRTALLLVSVVTVGLVASVGVVAADTPTRNPASSALTDASAANTTTTNASAADNATTDTAVADTTTTTDGQPIAGNVTYSNGTPAGDAVVLAGDYAFLMKSSPADLRAAADGNFSAVTVVPVNASGRFDASVPEDADAIVAVSDAGVSDVHRLSLGPTADLVLRPTKPLSFTVTDAVVEPGDRANVTFALRNDGDAPVEDLSLALGHLPAGWRVVHTSTTGQFSHVNRTFTWSSVPPDEWARATVTVSVPDHAGPGVAELGLTADSRSHRVSVPAATVQVEEPAATTVQTTLPGETDESTSSRSLPGFGPVAALAALLAVAALARRRID
ncbi:NEW3 domain-containing protein [Halobacteriaceae archaeon GCM10025711]